MARKVADSPPGGAFTWVVNPAPESVIGQNKDSRMKNRQVTKPGGKRIGRRRRNPLAGMSGMVNYLITAAAGGGTGVLEATMPSWYAKLGDAARVLLFGAAAVVSQRMKREQTAHALGALSTFFLGRVIGVRYQEMQASKATGENKAGAALRGILADIGEVVSPEMEAARAAYLQHLEELQQRQVQMPVNGLIGEEDIPDFDDVVNGIAYGAGVEDEELEGLVQQLDGIIPYEAN